MQKSSQAPKNTNPKPKKARRSRRKPQTQSQMTTKYSDAPVARGVTGSVKDVAMRNARNGNVIVAKSELVGDVVGTADFAVTTYSINAGLANLWMFLANIATNFDYYKLRKFHVRYIPANSTMNSGQVYLAVEFDPLDAPPVMEKQLSNYPDTAFCVPWKEITYKARQSNLNKRKSYAIRTGSVPAGGDIQLFDVGTLIVATTGCPAALIGKIWVDYEVELSTPDYLLTPAGRSLSSKYVAADNFATPVTVTGNAPLTASVNANVLTLTATMPYSGVLALNAGGTGIAALVTGGTGTTLVRNTTINGGSTALASIITSSFSVPGQTLTLSFTATTITSVGIRVGQYNVAVNA